nr:hypothetical protein [Tanacetum cinerariifolium]
MLALGNYVQWKSRIKRYIDTKPNNELIHYCLQNPPYKFKWTEKTVPVAEGSSETMVKDRQEKDKIGSKPDKNGKRDEAGKSQKQLLSREQEKLKKMQKEEPKMHTPTKNYNPKGERFLIASRFPTPPLACAVFSSGATVT